MRTRRSNKSFEMAPINRRNRKIGKRRRALNVVNETIVLSDSEDEVPVANDDDDIQVIDVANSTTLREPKVSPSTSKRRVSQQQSPAALKSENVNLEPPEVVDIEDENDPNDEDGVEVVAVVVSSSTGRRSASLKRSSLKRKSSNGSLSQSQGIVKRAKETVRRTSSIGARNADLLQVFNPLFKVSANSRKIRRRNNNNNNRRNKWRRDRFAGEQFQGRQRNALFHNRTRENDREVIFRPGNNAEKNDGNNFSFEAVPFIPINASTPAFQRNEQRRRWIPVKQRAPNPIAPGSNIMNAGEAVHQAKGDLRPIVIDGSNVAVGHGGMLQGGGNRFSARGIKICIDYFKKRGHKEILVFVPRFRLKRTECRDPELLEEMERQGHVKFTPSREAGGQRIASYDDLFVVEYAHEVKGIIISNDNFKDLYERKPHLQDTIKFRLLQYTWITQDVIMFPEDPLGRNGPSLDEFLRF